MSYHIGFDIGELNLSYCVSKHENNTYKIILWNNINIRLPEILCGEIKNVRAKCNKKCKYYKVDSNGSIIGFCKDHGMKKKKNKEKILLISNNNDLHISSKDRLNHVIVNVLQELNILYDKIKKRECKNVEVKIENQLIDNVAMKNIAGAIFVFFNMKKMEEIVMVKSVNYINASMKTTDVFIEKVFSDIKIVRYELRSDIYYFLKHGEECIKSFVFKKNKMTEKLKLIKLLDILINEKKYQKHMSDYDNRKNVVILMTYIYLYKTRRENLLMKYWFETLVKKDDCSDSFIYSLL